MISSAHLTPSQQALYDLLQRNGDVSFVDLYLAMGGDPERAQEVDQRGRHYAQCWLGSRLTRLNKRLKPTGQKVIPGRVKRTYCLACD
jgi:hypothetical protein